MQGEAVPIRGQAICRSVPSTSNGHGQAREGQVSLHASTKPRVSTGQAFSRQGSGDQGHVHARLSQAGHIYRQDKTIHRQGQTMCRCRQAVYMQATSSPKHRRAIH